MLLKVKTDDVRVNRLIKKHNKRVNNQNRGNWSQRWRQAGHFVVPDKDDVYTYQNRAKGDEKYGKLYDNSAVHFNELLSNALHSMLTNPSDIWMELNTRNKSLNNNPRVRKYLQEVVVRMTQLLNNSNFQSQIHEVYVDLGAFGTAVISLFDDDKDGVRFYSQPIYHFYIEENSRKVVDTISFVEKMKYEDAFEKYGRESFGKEADHITDLSKETDFLITVAPREKEEMKGLGQKSKPYAKTVVWVDEGIIVHEGGYNSFPFMVPRWMKVSDELYGRSPAMKAMPSIMMLNSMMKTTIRAAQKKVDPPLAIVDDGFLGRMNLTAGALNPFREGAGGGNPIFPIETRGDINLGIDLMSSVRGEIERAFFVDQLQLKDGPQMTATEVNARIESQLRMLGPLLGRLHNELLQPMVARLLDIMQEKNLMPENPPEELMGADFDLEVFFTSQIAKAQRSNKADSIVQYLADMAGVAEVYPEVADTLNPDSISRILGNLRGVPEEIFRTDKEKKDIRSQRDAAQSKAEGQNDTLAGAEVISKTAPLINGAAAGG